MPGVVVRLYAELNDFLPPVTRSREHPKAVGEGSTVRDVLRGLGIPDDQVDLILVNGESAPLGRIPKDGDRIAVYPVFESFDISRLTRLAGRPLRVPRFVLDVHLGKLCSHLRMLGFDALWDSNFADDRLRQLSTDERRVLLSRDRNLVASPDLTRSHFVQSTDPREQIVEVVRRFDLAALVRPFSRCISCNGVLEPVPPSAAADAVQPHIFRTFEEFTRCTSCGRIYWKGSHHRRMLELIEAILADVAELR